MEVRVPQKRLLSAISLNPLELNRLLQVCSNSMAVEQGKQVHHQITIRGLHHHPFMLTKLVQMYADCNSITAAHLLFDQLSQPNVFAWTAILSFYARNGMPIHCLRTYTHIKSKGTLPDKYVFPKLLTASAHLLSLELGTQIHKEVIAYGSELNIHVSNSLIHMYSKCEDVNSARRVFDLMVEPDLLSWNSIISGYVSNGFHALATQLFGYMRFGGFEPDLVTLNTVMDAYCRMGQCDEAWKLFAQIKEPNIISWTTLISGYSRIGNHEVTLGLLRNMMWGGKVSADLDCLSSALVSCRHKGELISGREIHAYGIKAENGFALYKSAGPALVTMYARCRSAQDARNVFKLMDKSDVVTWNAMIHGFSNLGMEHLALECFRNMQIDRIQNDQTTISTVLPVCDLKSGKQIHAHIRKNGYGSAIPVWNALIHMYSKCGCLKTAYSVFSNMERRDVVTWNAMIGGFRMHGYGQLAIQLLDRMSHSGFQPNSLTFTSVLSACSHSGLVEEGLNLFHRMSRDFCFNPKTEHFACIVDLLARAGLLEDAVSFIKRMNGAADKYVWGAVLAASRAHQNISVGLLASEHLVHLEPENAGHYVTLSNVCARAGQWDDAVRVRNLMESRNLVKPSGYSSVEIGN